MQYNPSVGIVAANTCRGFGHERFMVGEDEYLIFLTAAYIASRSLTVAGSGTLTIVSTRSASGFIPSAVTV